MPHVVLLGDSVFDNAAYVGGGPDVVRQLQGLIGSGAQASLAAVDGAVIADIPHQLARLPAGASHLVLSVGGNDALRAATVLQAPVRSVAEAMLRLAEVGDAFTGAYAAMLEKVAGRGLPVAACTIYEPRFPEPAMRRAAATALAVLNDAITRTLFVRGVALVDLRTICDDDADFANPIEPSVQGGAKIAAAIAAWVSGSGLGRSLVIAR